MMPPLEINLPECLLLEDRGNGLFALVRTEDSGKRSEFDLTIADLVCLRHLIEGRIQVWLGTIHRFHETNLLRGDSI